MIAHTFSLLQSVYPDFPALFTLRSKAESPLYPVLCSREVLGATSYFVLADMLDAYDPHRRAEGHGTIERREPGFLDSLQEELGERRYRPGPVLRVMKGPFDYPRRHLTFVKDRIVHTALMLVIENALSGACPECNEKMDILEALRTTVHRGSRDFNAFAFEECGAANSYQTLLRLVVAHVHDDEVRRLLKLFMKAPVVEVWSCEWRDTG
ncbi:hypothetical protein [Geminisphaera colitermitum]|uniref:hypothetical protein n=1 Tax=Geminisphaera colitermitum TaxID=1148786 RepID=UPI000158D332|nr:hypothetical protein [Geminisphaera colitermitum]